MIQYQHLDHYTEKINGVEFDMVFIKGQQGFVIGDGSRDNNKPQTVNVPDFWIGQTLVTQELWQAVTGENPSSFQSLQRPVDSVSWFHIHEKFLGKLNEIAKKNNSPCIYTLPTEVCWEYAAVAGNRQKYAGSDTIQEVAWYDNNSHQCTQVVGLKKPNAFGLYDMSGNLTEWTNTIYEENNYENNIKDVNTIKNDSNTHIVQRGGSWFNYDVRATVAYRNYYFPLIDGNYDGFRLFSLFAQYL